MRIKTGAGSMRSLWRGFVICIAAAAIAAFCTHYLRLFNDASTTIEDLQVSLLKPLPQSPDVLVLTITEEILAEFPYRSPINRGYLNDLIRLVLERGARLIALDIIFDRPTEADLDERLRQTLNDNADSIVVAIGDDIESGLSSRQLGFQAEYLRNIAAGYADISTTDGVARHIYPGREDDPIGQPSFVAAIARQLDIDPPTETTRLHFRHDPAQGDPPILAVPADLDAVGVYFDNWFEDRVVLVGVDLSDVDRWETPVSQVGEELRLAPGVMIHAQALAQILEGRRYPAVSAWFEILIVAAAVVAGYLLPLASTPVLVQALAGALALTLYWILGFGLALASGFVLPIMTPTISFIASATLSAGHGYRLANQEKRFLTTAFRHYVSPAIINEVIASPDKLSLGGEKRELSFIFCDVAGFTSLSEQLDPEAVVRKLQEYLDGMLSIALRHDGTIDRLVGDGIAVIFGAPVSQPDHARRAVACALEIDRFGESFRASQIAAGIDWGVTRIGVHTGPAVVGNVGSSEHFHYTAHGDCVNSAARLEGANRTLGTRLCISKAAADQCPDQQFRPVGKLVLKGKLEALECVTDCKGLSDEQLQRYLEAYRLLENRDSAAVERLESLSAELPEDGLTGLHLNRARAGRIDTQIVLAEK